ncbi:MAG: helix-turn-helix domain-containing protein [Nitrospirae bacterium]|nr:helix-turn-helix domain-containing protein [Nitrospirota bacterium]
MSGLILKKKREELGLDIRDVSVLLKIKLEYLSYIESDKFDSLPAPVYTIGYIRSYSRYLGVDPEDIIALYSKQLPQPKTDVPVMPVILERQTRGPKVLYIAVACVIAAAVGFILYNRAPLTRDPAPRETAVVPRQTSPTPDLPDMKQQQAGPAAAGNKGAPEIPPQGETPAPAAALPQTKEPARTPQQPARGVPDQKTTAADKDLYRLSVSASDTSWIFLQFKNGKSQELTLRAGETREWSFSEGASLRIGNAGGVQVLFDGKNLGPVGKKGEAVTLRFPPGTGQD